MDVHTARREVTVVNSQGLHMRPAYVLVKAANRFQSRVELIRDGERFDAKSILSVMTVGAEHGVRLLLEAHGVDAAAALDRLSELFADGFADEETTS